ncbi:MAG: hypothetical protein AAB780_01700 [Patescibacteria group bacterium]
MADKPYRLERFHFDLWKTGDPSVAIIHNCGTYLRTLNVPGEDHIWCKKCGCSYLVTDERLQDPESNLTKDCKAEDIFVYRMSLRSTVNHIGSGSSYTAMEYVDREDLIAYRKKHQIWFGNDVPGGL